MRSCINSIFTTIRGLHVGVFEFPPPPTAARFKRFVSLLRICIMDSSNIPSYFISRCFWVSRRRRWRRDLRKIFRCRDFIEPKCNFGYQQYTAMTCMQVFLSFRRRRDLREFFCRREFLLWIAVTFHHNLYVGVFGFPKQTQFYQSG